MVATIEDLKIKIESFNAEEVSKVELIDID